MRLSSAPARFASLVLAIAVATTTALAQERELVVQRWGPGQRVAFSRDGRLLATTNDYQGPTLLWETATGRLLRELPPAPQTVLEQLEPGHSISSGSLGASGQAVVFSPDGRHLAAAPLSLRHAMNGGFWSFGAPAVWELATGRPLATKSWVRRDSVVSNPTVPWTAAEITAWGAAGSEAAAHRLAGYHGPIRVIDSAGRIGVAMEGERDVRVVTVRELPGGREIGRLPGTFHDLWVMALSPDGRRLALRSQAPGIELWDLPTLRRVATIPPERFGQSDVMSFSPDGTLLAIAGYGRLVAIRLADLATTIDIAAEANHDFPTSDLAFSADGRLIAVAGGDLVLVDVARGAEVRRIGGKAILPTHAWALGARGLVVARTLFDPYGSDRLSDRGRATLELWPSDSGAPRALDDSARMVASLAFDPTGRLLAVGHEEGGVVSRYHGVLAGGLSVWDLATGRRLPGDTTLGGPVSQVLFTPSGRLFALHNEEIVVERACSYVACGEEETTSYDVELVRVDPLTGARRRLMWLGRRLNGMPAPFLVSPRGSAVLALDESRTRLLQVPTGTRVPGFRRAALDSLSVSDDSRGLAEFSADGSRLLRAGERGVVVARSMTGRVLAHHDSFGDLGASYDEAEKLVTAHFIPGDSTGVALVLTRSDLPGSTLLRLDTRTDSTRPWMRFDDEVDDLLFAADGRVWTRAGGVIRLHEPDGRVAATLLRGADGGWLVTTSDGLYDAGGTGAELAAWRVGGRLVSALELPPAFRVSGLLGRLLRGERLAAPAWPR